MDLFLDEVHIIIQWETAASKGGPSERGYSVAYLKDISLYKTTGKMLFGWAINNSITKNAGSIKFSVRFYKFNSKQELDFSLSTLTAQATINPGLDFTWNKDTGKFAETIYDDSQMIANRFRDSVQPGEVGEADAPVFLRHLDKTYKLTIMEDGKEVEYDAIDLEKIVDEENNSVLQRDFIIPATGEGIISYTWQRKDLSTGNEMTLESGPNIGTQYVLTEDTVYSGEKLYYVKTVADGVTSYSVFTVAPGMKDQPIDQEVLDAGLYEKVSHCKVVYPNGLDDKNVTGIYIATAINKVGQAKGFAKEKVLIPGPDKDTFTVELPEKQSENVLLIDGPEGVGQATLSVLGKTARVTDDASGIVGDTIVYTWNGETPIETTNVASPVANEYSIAPVAVEDRALYDATVTVDVYATRNGEKSEVKSQSFRITDSAHAPEVTIGQKDTGSKNVRLKTASQTAILEAVVVNQDAILHTNDGDGITFEWRKANADYNEDGSVSDKFVISNDDLIVDTDNCITIEGNKCLIAFRPDHITLQNGELAGQGFYYCIAKNTVNGSEAVNDITNFTVEDCISITVAG